MERGGSDHWGDDAGTDDRAFDEEWVRPVRRGQPSARRDPGARTAGPRRPPTRGDHDPFTLDTRRTPRRGAYAGAWSTSRQLPAAPTILTALVAVVLAFVVGRATGGNGAEQAVEVPASTSTTTSTTVVAITHTVAKGETLVAIASRYGITPDELAAANNITDANKVLVGQVLKVPAPVP